MSIFNSIKRLVKHSAVYGIGHIITRSFGFLLLPLYTNIFPRDDFGVAGLVFTYLAIFINLYTFGIDVAFFRYFILEETEQGKKKIFTTAFVTMTTTSLVFSLLIFFNAPFLAKAVFSANVHELTIDLIFLIRLAAGILFFDAIGLLPFLILRAREKSLQFIVFKFVNVLINVGFNILLLGVLKKGIEGIFIANFISSFVTFIVMLLVVLKNLSFSYSFITLKDLFAFGLPYMPSTLSVVLMDTIDRVFIERLMGVDAVGLYQNGAKLGMFMALFVTAFRFAWHPFFLSTSKQDDARDIFAKVFTYVITACGVVFIFFSLFIENIVRLHIGRFSLIGQIYWESTIVVPVIFLAYIFYAAYLNFLIGIYLYKKTRYLPFITVGGMLGNLVALYFLIPVMGIMGAAWARLIAYVIMAVALYLVSRKLYPVSYEWTRILKLAVIISVVFFIGQIGTVASSLWLKILLFSGLPVALYITGFMDPRELNKMKTLLITNGRNK